MFLKTKRTAAPGRRPYLFAMVPLIANAQVERMSGRVCEDRTRHQIATLLADGLSAGVSPCQSPDRGWRRALSSHRRLVAAVDNLPRGPNPCAPSDS
jgi:hypothetical protein